MLRHHFTYHALDPFIWYVFGIWITSNKVLRQMVLIAAVSFISVYYSINKQEIMPQSTCEADKKFKIVYNGKKNGKMGKQVILNCSIFCIYYKSTSCIISSDLVSVISLFIPIVGFCFNGFRPIFINGFATVLYCILFASLSATVSGWIISVFITVCGIIKVLSTNLFFLFWVFSTTFCNGLNVENSSNSSLKVILLTAMFNASLFLCRSFHIFHLDSGDPSFFFLLRMK